MANQTPTSRLIGANFSSNDSTMLFALGTQANGTNGALYEYVCATATLNTGQLCFINPAGSAQMLQTASLTANANGLQIGAAQNIIDQGNYGWVAVHGQNLYVMCTGTVTAGGENGVAFSANSGRPQNAPACGVGATCFGIYITTSASTATASVAVATLVWPRGVLMNQ